MKKRLGIILSALVLSIGAFAVNPGNDNDIDVGGIFNPSPTVSLKSFNTSEVTPAVNILTGTKDAYTFDAEDVEEYFYNADYSTASQYTHTIETDEAKGNVFAVTLDETEYNKSHSTNDIYVYSSLSADFSKKLDRPVHLYFETYGTKQIGFWLSSGSTHVSLGQLGTDAWKKMSVNNTKVFNQSMKKLVIQYATRPSDCSDVQYYDNLAVYPYYKITYKGYNPDGSAGTDTVKYYFDASALSVADNGTVTGLPSSYTVENVEVDFFGYTVDGWSTEKNSDTPVKTVALNGEDIVLYPVWKESENLTIPEEHFVPGINIFTGNTKAIDFSLPTHIKYFKNTQGYDEAMFTYDTADDPSGSGKGKMLRVTLDTEKFLAKYAPETYTYHNITAFLEKAIDRPGLLVFDTYGKGTVGFWLSAGTTFKGMGTLPGSYSWYHVAQNNSDIYNGNMSAIYMQYGINAKTCGNVQCFDNIAFIPYYKATYVINYPDGTSAEPKEKFFLCKNNEITVSNDGTIKGIPTEFAPENLDISFPGYDLAGWTTEKNGKTAMTNIPLKNEDITVYPVWEKKAEQIPVTLTVYLDEAKKKSTTYNLFAGDTFTLPGYYDLTEYTPDGKLPKGFMLDGKLYAPGKTFNVPEVTELTAEAQYENAYSSEYGDLVFLENFESIKKGTYIYNPDTGTRAASVVSYINPKWSTNRSHFVIDLGDTGNVLQIIDDGTGNNVLKIQKVNAEQNWPQFYIHNKGNTPEGYYTFVIDFCAPSNHVNGISNFNFRSYYTASKFEALYRSISASDADKWKTYELSMPIKADSAYEALTKFQVYISAKGGFADTACYIDNIALYVKCKEINIKLNDEKATKIFYADGESVTFPYSFEIYDSIPEGYVLSHFTNGSKNVKPGEMYSPTDADNGSVFEAVYEKAEYSLKFDLGNANGTVAEIPVKDGEAVTLPKVDGVMRWKAYGTGTTYNPGESFTFAREAEKANLDGVNRLVFTALFEKEPSDSVNFYYNYKLVSGMFEGATDAELAELKIAYSAGIIPASHSFDTDASVTLSDLVKVAERLYYRSRNKTSHFDTDAKRLADMVNKGVCPEYKSLDAKATFADAAVVLANALCDSYYPEIAFDVKVSGLAYGDEGYAEALKLIRAGILPESTDFAKEISYGELVSAIAKTVKTSERTVENKRTLYILGDSLTATKGTIGWPTKLEPFLDGNLKIVNHGIGGINTSTYHSIYDSTGGGLLYVDMLQNINPGDYVVVALGTNDSTLWGWGDMKYEESRDNYLKYIRQIRSEGGIPILVCPVGRNNTDTNGKLIESDPLIIKCMKDVNELYGVNAPIINFKDVSLERLGAMTAAERLKIYADNVHYTSYGAEVVAGWFGELVEASTDIQLACFANHFKASKETHEIKATFTQGEEKIADNKFTDGDLTATVEFGEIIHSATIVIAQYNGTRLVKSVNTSASNTDSIGYTLPELKVSEGNVVKVFIFKDTISLLPVCEVFELTAR